MRVLCRHLQIKFSKLNNTHTHPTTRDTTAKLLQRYKNRTLCPQSTRSIVLRVSAVTATNMRNSSNGNGNGNKPNLKEERTIETIKLPCEISRTFQRWHSGRRRRRGNSNVEGNKETRLSAYIHIRTYVQIENVTRVRLYPAQPLQLQLVLNGNHNAYTPL